jgi:hypothetical protein
MQFALGQVHQPIATAINIPVAPYHVIAIEQCISSAVFLGVIRALRPSINYYYKYKHAPSESLF